MFPRQPRVTIKTFYANYRVGKPPVRLAEVNEAFPVTTGRVVTADFASGQRKIVLLSRRRVARPARGQAYYAWRYAR